MGFSRQGFSRPIRALAAMALAAAWAMAGSPWLAAPPRAQPALVILGSSTAFGSGATNRDSSWAGRYARDLGSRSPMPWTVVNLAVSGYTTYHILPTRRAGSEPAADRPAPDTSHNISKALALRPLGIIVNMPSNDAASGYGAAEQRANYDTLAAEAARAGVALWIGSPQPRTPIVGDPGKRAVQIEVKDWVLARFAPRAIDFWSGLAGADGSIDPALDAGDGIHLNDRGHRILYERVRAARIPETLEAGVSLAPPAPRSTGPDPENARPHPAGLLAPGFPYDARGRSLPPPRVPAPFPGSLR